MKYIILMTTLLISQIAFSRASFAEMQQDLERRYLGHSEITYEEVATGDISGIFVNYNFSAPINRIIVNRKDSLSGIVYRPFSLALNAAGADEYLAEAFLYSSSGQIINCDAYFKDGALWSLSNCRRYREWGQ